MARHGEDWSREENEAIVADYFSMLVEELSGRRYSKAEHRRNLQRHVHRSDGSIEYKHQNISAVLIENGRQYIRGYKPAYSYQRALAEVVLSRLEADAELEGFLAADAERSAEPAVPEDLLSIVATPPRRDRPADRGVAEGLPAPRRHRRIDYLEREARNRHLGNEGERFAIEFESARLRNLGRADLARRIEHVSSTRGDGDGFDILSYEQNGEERYIEVKTTKYGAFTPFFVTSNELHVSNVASDRYHLYRLYEFGARPRLYQLQGSLREHCGLTPTVFRAEVGFAS